MMHLIFNKNKLSTLFFITLIASAFCGCGEKTGKISGNAPKQAKATPIDENLRKRVEEFAKKPRVKGKFAFCVYDLTADKKISGFNENEALPCASCMKLLTGIAGINMLGTQYKYTTSLYTRGRVANGVLLGDLSFKGSLDPQMDASRLSEFGEAAKKMGIKKIAGRFVVDLALKEPVKSEPHWYPWDLSFSKYGILYKGRQTVLKNLKKTMRVHGISIADSQIVQGKVPRGSKRIYASKLSIEDVIKRMWKNSSNTQATALLYTIGKHASPGANPAEAGVSYLRRFLSAELKQKNSSCVVHDGCGLCTQNRLSPTALVSILRFGYRDTSIYGMLCRQLSLSGVDGTLAREMTGPKTKGKIRAKTGTLSHPYGISSLAGYCKGRNNHLLAFAIMNSDMSVLDARVLQRKLCELLVE